MRPSSPSQISCTQVPIKVKHREAKKRAIRRRRIDIPCGCTVYVAFTCRDNGFTHRGNHHCASSREWRSYLDNQQSPFFQNPTRNLDEFFERESHRHPDPVQSQPQEGIGDSHMFSQLPNLDDFTPSDWSFLNRI
ncbi:transcription activation protein TrAp [Hollyhock leaf crumple virus-[Cairo]]|uniref:Transcriptional activator protein n=1 Tax=Hollyhock leaf crumple virus-[Cairo] TaxID=223279 RepID=Q8V0I2_9GEMI|nr:transcription activation protein TrAp [Hollyhock leaf crumple virus]AAK64550.1 transcription activation protein TrAp [Hollyhock leaf crumple virus-[Cairo]]